jgi:hypothetical protein
MLYYVICHKLCIIGKLPLSIAVSELSPGVNTLEIVLSDADGDMARYAANITVGAGVLINSKKCIIGPIFSSQNLKRSN